MKPLIPSLLLIAAVAALPSCSRKPTPPPSALPEVAVVTVAQRSILLTTELPGRTSPSLIAEIRRQVSGLIQRRLFTEGADVKAGQVLYQIDPAPFKAAVDNAAANLEAARKAADRARARRRPSARRCWAAWLLRRFWSPSLRRSFT